MDEWISATRCWSPSPSPDGTTIAFVWDGDGRPQVRMHRRATGEEWSLDTGDELVSTVRWSPDGAWLAVETAPDGGERSNVSIIRPDGSDLRPVRGVGDADRGAVTLDRFTHTGSVLAITESDYDTTTAWLVDAETSQRQRVGSGHALQILDVSRDRRRVLLRRGRRGSRHVGIVDLDGTEGWHEIDARARPGRPAGRRGAPGGHHPRLQRGRRPLLPRRHPDVPAHRRRARAGGAGARRGRHRRPPDDARGARRARRRRARALRPHRGRRASPRSCGTPRGAARSTCSTSPPASAGAYAPPGDVVTSAVFSHDGDSLVMGIQAPEVPAAVWCHELSSDTTALICPQEEPTWSPGQLVHPSLEVVTTPDGLRLPGWLYRPRGQSGPLPTVIYLHGGPEAQERPVFTPLYQHLLARGHRRLRGQRARLVGVRALVRQRRQRRRALRGDPRRRDVRRAPRGAPASPTRTRIGVMGRSYGGYLTLAALVNHPELFAVGIDVCGMADFETFFARTEPWIADAAVGEYGHPIHDRNLLRELSPVHRMEHLRAPLLVIHGKFDTNVPVHEAELAVHGAKAAGVPLKYLLFDDEGHEIQRTENRVRFIHECVDWLCTHFGLD